MASTKIIVPDYQFSGMYYSEILQRVRSFNRVNCPEITAETAEEPFIQLERAFSLVGHQNNVLLDLAANELLVPTMKLRESARRNFRLIDYQLKDYSPAAVELLAKLTQVLTTSQTIVEANSLFETERTDEVDAVPFEVVDAVSAGPTDVVDAAYSETTDRSGSDGATVFGDPDAFESATLAAASADVGSILEISGSILGNNAVYKVVEVLEAGSPGKFRLASVYGGDDPFFVFETGLDWRLLDVSANAATEVSSAGSPYWTPWTGPVAGDKLYLASSFVLPEKLALAFQTVGAGITGVWEYYDPDASDEAPNAVSNQGSFLRFTVDSLLDPDSAGLDRRDAFVEVTYLPSGQSERVRSSWSGSSNYVDVSAFLGQSGTPSTDVGDYSVGTDWNPLPGLSDGTADLSVDGDLEYDLPQTLLRNWAKSTVEGVEGYYLRYRVVSVSSPTAPVVDVVDPGTGEQYALLEATQGETVTNEPLASSNGQENQTFELGSSPGLFASVRMLVNEGGTTEVEWTNLTATNDSLATSGPKDRHFEVAQNDLGVLTVKTGDGTRGRIPPTGTDNLRFEYRVGADDEGNVGAGTVVVNSTGSSFLDSVENPRAAYGWKEAEGASDESLALVKETGPASLRTLGRAITTEDHEDLAVAFEASDGTRPVVRAKAIEEGFGPKTIWLVVVGSNGGTISGTIRDEIEAYFNGDPADGVEGVGRENTEVTVTNYAPLSVGPTVVIEANSAITEQFVRTTLATLISPTATESDGTKWVWKFGGRLAWSRVASEIFALSPGNVFDVDVTSPTADLEFDDDGLPLLDSASLSISIVAPKS